LQTLKKCLIEKFKNELFSKICASRTFFANRKNESKIFKLITKQKMFGKKRLTIFSKFQI